MFVWTFSGVIEAIGFAIGIAWLLFVFGVISINNWRSKRRSKGK